MAQKPSSHLPCVVYATVGIHGNRPSHHVVYATVGIHSEQSGGNVVTLSQRAITVINQSKGNAVSVSQWLIIHGNGGDQSNGHKFCIS